MSISPQNANFSALTEGDALHSEDLHATAGMSGSSARERTGKLAWPEESHGVPPQPQTRLKIRRAIEQLLADPMRPKKLNKATLQKISNEILQRLQLNTDWMGYVMVILASLHNRAAIIKLPFQKRLLLLPDVQAIDSETTTLAASFLAQIERYRERATELGYRVETFSHPTRIVQLMLSGRVRGVIGIASLRTLEKAYDKIRLSGLPAYAIPQWISEAGNWEHDADAVWQILEQTAESPRTPDEELTSPLLEVAQELFLPEQLSQLLPEFNPDSAPYAGVGLADHTREISLDWLIQGGKRFRPFITLAAYTACQPDRSSGFELSLADFPVSLRRAAVAIEAFHKASLIHDDIQDDDQFRYGRETLHRMHGVGAAINYGDYLIGIGYRLLAGSQLAEDLSAVSDLVAKMSQAHIQLCAGQGKEMEWTSSPSMQLTVADAIEIYALKTSPGFEAAVYSGIRLSSQNDDDYHLITEFSRQLGIGFQILNDLKDWQGDFGNKVVAGQDAKALRPTVMLALAIETANPTQLQQLEQVLRDSAFSTADRYQQLRILFSELNVLKRAHQLVDDYRQQAEQTAMQIGIPGLRDYLQFLVQTVLCPEKL